MRLKNHYKYYKWVLLKTKMQVHYHTISFGADPEFFFTKKGEVVGAEKVLPKEGIRLRNMETGELTGTPLVIIDGVQAEFNPQPNTCRQSFSTNLKACFTRVAEEMNKSEGIQADFSALVEVSKHELKTLSEESQQFGCAPSKNAYKESKISIKDASKYPYRSAGGHVHLGMVDSDTAVFFKKDPKHVIQMLDILLGNTCVLIDRHPGNIERRKVYGKAGEYRTPAHGLEYRTLSNFWIRNYQLMSFVLGMARFAVCVSMDAVASKAILERVDVEKIQRAINENDFDLALENFNGIKELISGISAIEGNAPIWPLQGSYMQGFEYLVSKGLDFFFKEDPMKFWLKHEWRQDGVYGWEQFATYVLNRGITKELKDKKPSQPVLVGMPV